MQIGHDYARTSPNAPINSAPISTDIDSNTARDLKSSLIPPSNQVLAAPVVGTEVPWAMTPDTANTYAAGAVVTAIIVDDSVTISDTKTSQPIFTIDVTDADTTDLVAVTSGFSVMKTAGSSLFSVVKTATGCTYPLNITATDRCGDTATGTITVTVTNTAESASTLNHDVTAVESMTITCSDGTDQITSSYKVDISDAAPVLTNFAGTSGPLGDLSPFTVTDQDDAISCSINAPESAKFGITKVDTATGAQHVVTLFSDVIFMMMMIVIYTAAAAAYDDDVIEEEEVDVDDEEEKDSFFNVVPGTAPTFAIWVKAGVKLDAATSPFLVNVQCVDDRSPANIITETFTVPLLDKFQVWVSAAVTQASIDFNDQAVPLPLTITCTDGNTAITGTFNVNIIDEPPVISVLPAIGTAINDGLQTVATILQHVQRDRQR
ncbi:hypothetical protein DPMN_018958 [Dreissena polymorpha]|uniref:Cadherin domain-containing protein n=1 Tax=Dreissena polymorpha TaxID=45954 RepID=A0A9D4NJS4_DREPO|nr:hypothetical protein DPMN_018958 [Dreissena polymorpha]